MDPVIFPDGRGVYKDTVHFTRPVGDTLSFEFAGTFLHQRLLVDWLIAIYRSVVVRLRSGAISQNGSMTVTECVGKSQDVFNRDQSLQPYGLLRRGYDWWHAWIHSRRSAQNPD